MLQLQQKSFMSCKHGFLYMFINILLNVYFILYFISLLLASYFILTFLVT